MKTSETMDFTVDQNIISHLISHQAGTIIKALMELVMNSVDAQATKIDIEVSNTRFMVKDNGLGFENKEDIIQFFGRFGKPHTEEEDERRGTVYGRFRMGRGQIMAFSKCSWRSSAFKMDVDIQNKGLTYDLQGGLDETKGCVVEGDFYETGYRIDTDEIRKTLKYVDIDVVLNGTKINRDPKEDTWDYENEQFYYRDDNDYSLSIYNQGAYVLDKNSHVIGCGGTIVSKKRMEVNFARNDILIQECEVWDKMDRYLREHSMQKKRK